MTRPFHGSCEFPLVLAARAGLPSLANPAPIIQVIADDVDVLVVCDKAPLVGAEVADLLLLPSSSGPLGSRMSRPGTGSASRLCGQVFRLAFKSLNQCVGTVYTNRRCGSTALPMCVFSALVMVAGEESGPLARNRIAGRWGPGVRSFGLKRRVLSSRFEPGVVNA